MNRPGDIDGRALYRQHVLVAIVLAAAGVLLVAWSIFVPVFESPDEPHHWQYARHLHDHRSLPLYSPTFVEANSPPVYYALIAPFASRSDLPPRMAYVDAEGRMMLASSPRLYQNAADDLWRYRGVRLARLVTVLLTLVGIWCTYRAGAVMHGTAAGVAAAALFGFLPMVTFKGGTVSNDAAVATFSAAFTWMTIAFVGHPGAVRYGIPAALGLALAFLSKISAIGLAPALLLASVLPARSLQAVVRRTSIFLVAALVVLPWCARNVWLYGDPFASGAMEQAVGHIIVRKSVFSPYFLEPFPRMLYQSTVGVFGWMQLYLPTNTYLAYGAVWLFGLACAVPLVLRDRLARWRFYIVGAAVLGTFAIVVYINLRFDQPQGRYMLPALPALAVLAGTGWVQLWPARYRLVVAGVLTVSLVLGNAWVLGTSVVRPYWPAPTPTITSESCELPLVLAAAEAPSRAIWAAPTMLPAREFRWVAFTVQAPSLKGVHTGSISIMVNGAPAPGGAMPFTWKAGAEPWSVVVPLAMPPQTGGLITRVEVHALPNASDQSLVTITGARLHARLTSDDEVSPMVCSYPRPDSS